MTPSAVIDEVRRLIQDTRTPYRYSDAILLGFVNQALKRIAMLRPDLFSYIGEISTTANSTVQSLPADSARLVEIFNVKDGSAVTEVSRETPDQSTPSWTSEAAGTPVDFMRHVRNPNRYFLYPRPTSGVVLIGEYVQVPPTYTINQSIALLPDAYFPVVVDATVFLAESVDNEHVNSGRAKLFLDSYTQALGVNLQSRMVTDTESAGMDEKQVL